MMHDRIVLKLAGETVEFKYNRASREVYNPLFPGIPIHQTTLHCGHVLHHDALVSIIEAKLAAFELDLAT